MSSQPYRVLARKYRPQTFETLIGQEALVQTLRNAISTGRIAQAYMLTGVRGTGKTTTARIFARALNCIGADGTGTEPVTTPCGVCDNCTAIAEDRHLDVIERDAASNRGIQDMLELLETAAYRPAMARKKVYILDEVHMLTKEAFNALLKTLEEPPSHVVFIFATTDLHKVPVTILSRCQRFDLRRVSTEILATHLHHVAGQEDIPLEETAATLLAGAAGGSVRDSLSLLDQAIALASGETVTATLVQEMLGLVGQADLHALLQNLLTGDAAATLTKAGELYYKGAEAVVILQDLQTLLHRIARHHAAPSLTAEMELVHLQDFAGKLPISRAMLLWQMVGEGIKEVMSSENPLSALEMILLRLSYAQELPDPSKLLEQMQSGNVTSVTPARPVVNTSAQASPSPQSFVEVMELCTLKRQARLSYVLKHQARLVKFQQGMIELYLPPETPADLATTLAAHLLEWTGCRWMVSLAPDPSSAQPTLAHIAQQETDTRLDHVRTHPLVAAAMQVFPEATLRLSL